jgi:CRP/FNR family cyclic AMP-dependent transcriptional regulator
LSGATRPAIYPGGAVLFVEGQTARGTFVLCSGKVKLSITSREGKVLIVKMAPPGEVLGLSAVITGECYEFTAETSGPCQVNFVERQALLRLMEKYGELGLNSAQTLSREFQSVFRDIHELGAGTFLSREVGPPPAFLDTGERVPGKRGAENPFLHDA